jgi:hypothetical protein
MALLILDRDHLIKEVEIMNKFMIISICIISFGLFTTHALGMDNTIDLSASEFFYGEPVDMNTVAINTPDVRIKATASSSSIDLAAPAFFYGLPVGVQALILNGDLPQKTDVAVPTNEQITPGAFYGYTDVTVGEEAPCAKC